MSSGTRVHARSSRTRRGGGIGLPKKPPTPTCSTIRAVFGMKHGRSAHACQAKKYIYVVLLHKTRTKAHSRPLVSSLSSNQLTYVPYRTWIVLPRPISSARIPLKPFSYSVTSHRRPSSWYGFRVPPTRFDGCEHDARAHTRKKKEGNARQRASKALVFLAQTEKGVTEMKQQTLRTARL